LAGTPTLLVNPRVAVPTAAVFGGWDGVDKGPLGSGALLDIARAGRNDLQPSALRLAPVIAEVLALLGAQPGVVLSRMSGSGATCFALFDSVGSREAAARAASRWWCLETALA
jgi:4-diphosphocytidyl-2-C-methyl-D-erythritol kinase